MEQQEAGMLLELLEIIEKELGIAFTPEEQKKLKEFLKSNPNADPEKIMAEIFLLIEKKLQAKLSLEKTKKLKDRFRLTKLLVNRAKNAAHKSLTVEERIYLLIRAIEKKLFGVKVIRRELNEKERQKAAEYYQKNANPNDSPIAKANVALLGVVSVGIAGGIKPVVLQSWGNLLNAPSWNPYHGLSGGGAAGDQAARINPMRSADLELQEVINIIHIANVDHNKITKLVNIAANQAPQPAHNPAPEIPNTPAPTLKPFGDPKDPFR